MLPDDPDELAVRAVIAGVSQAWGDAAAFTSYYAPAATAIIPGFQLTSAEVIRGAMAAAFDGGLKGTSRIHDIRSVRFPHTGMAVVISRSGTVFPGSDEVSSWSFSTMTLTRHGERWLIEAYHDCQEEGAP